MGDASQTKRVVFDVETQRVEFEKVGELDRQSVVE